MTLDVVAAAWFLLDISLRALAAAAAVALVLRVLRVRAAAVLHAAWSAVLLAMLFMPALPSIVPTVPVPVPANAGALLGASPTTDEPSPDASVPSAGGVDVSSTIPGPTTDLARSADRRPPSTGARDAGSWLPLALLGAYLAGLLFFGARLLSGWYLAAAMIRRAKRGGRLRDIGAPADVYESSEVTVPMTVGAIRPVIVLPATWKAWKADTLTAIVAHEAAHVSRRDALINLAAHLNRAIFWFHPLAWWLERKLALTAEHACDAAAARAIATPRRYAQILVEMADVVRRNRGRLAWQAVGVNGAGHLDSRIDRLLYGDAFATASRGKKFAVGVACVLALTTVIACRGYTSAAPLRQDPELSKRLADQDERMKRFEATRNLTQEQADALEQRLAVNPGDFDAREQLVTYYRASKNVAWDKKVPGLRRHALWLIEHHPEHEIAAPPLSPRYDPEGFAAARKLWETHLAKPGVTPFLVYRAASFFAPHDKPYAEQLILRGLKMDPESAALKARMPPDVGGYQWPAQLSSLYAAALRGSESAWGMSDDLRTHLDQVSSPYAIEVRRKIDTTTDATLLAGVGRILARQNSPTKDPALDQALEQIRALGIRYLERALQLDPNLQSAKAQLVRIAMPGKAIEADRLANQAHEEYMQAEDITEYSKKDLAAGKQQRDKAKAGAEEVLKMAAGHPKDPAYSAAIMIAHHVLATDALRDGDRERAVRHMRESVNVPTSEQMQYVPPFSWLRPVNRLLKEGERERVVEFLEAFAKLTITERDRLLKDAQAIREGRMTSSYQRTVAREGQ
jgi:hypothetical protein